MLCKEGYEMETKGDKAKRLFEEGYNCCQSVVLAYAEELGLEREAAARLASGMGGGISRLREVCGAVSGMALILGLAEGYSAPGDTEGKAAVYETVQKLANRFREENGSLLCRELLEASGNRAEDDPLPSARTGEYYSRRPCGELVACAASLLEEHFQDENEKG